RSVSKSANARTKSANVRVRGAVCDHRKLSAFQQLPIKTPLHVIAESATHSTYDSGGHPKARLDAFTGSTGCTPGPALPSICCGCTQWWGTAGGIEGGGEPTSEGDDRKLPAGRKPRCTILTIFGFMLGKYLTGCPGKVLLLYLDGLG